MLEAMWKGWILHPLMADCPGIQSSWKDIIHRTANITGQILDLSMEAIKSYNKMVAVTGEPEPS